MSVAKVVITVVAVAATLELIALMWLYFSVGSYKAFWVDKAKQEGELTYLAGSCFITIGQHDAVKGKSANPERIIFFFETEDVQGEFDRIAKLTGAAVVKEPYNPGGDKFVLATLSDPDGNYFQLSSPWDA